MSTPIFEQVRVRRLSELPDVLAADIDHLNPRTVPAGHTLTITGWTAGQHQPVTTIELLRPSEVVARAPVGESRPELAVRFPNRDWASTAGFRLDVDALRLDPEFDLRLRAVLADGTKVPFGLVRGRRRSVLGGYRPRFQPLMVTSLGRTGSTLLMRLLAEHPGVVTYRQYPYEVRPAKYWLHLFRVLSARPNPAKVVGQPQEFHLESLAVGANPFRAPAFAAAPTLEAWADSDYVERLAAFSQQSIDEWYTLTAAAQDDAGAVYFAEKQFPDEFPRLAWSLYPAGRELLLVRDFRDMVSSMLAYNRKRGFDDFGRVGRENDEEWVRSLVSGVNELARAAKRRADRVHVVRYEDLVTDAAPTLTGIFAYLGLDASAPAIARVISRAADDSAELKRHQTTRDPAASIGRWRQDLPAPLQDVTNDAFGHALATFGYDPV